MARTSTDRALAPVVGVALLLALTVLLATTAGVYFLEFGDAVERETTPTTALDFDPELGSGPDTVTIEHDTGDVLDTEDLYVVVSDATCEGGSGDPNGRYNVDDDFGLGGRLSAGMTIQYGEDLDLDGTDELCTAGGDLSVSGATFSVIWDPGTGRSTELQSWTAP